MKLSDFNNLSLNISKTATLKYNKCSCKMFTQKYSWSHFHDNCALALHRWHAYEKLEKGYWSCPSYQTRHWQTYALNLGPTNPHTMFFPIHHGSLNTLETVCPTKQLLHYFWQTQTPKSSIQGFNLILPFLALFI